jgi:hypothetical protein
MLNNQDGDIGVDDSDPERTMSYHGSDADDSDPERTMSYHGSDANMLAMTATLRN